jgi:hypothetical protein
VVVVGMQVPCKFDYVAAAFEVVLGTEKVFEVFRGDVPLGNDVSFF